MLTSEKKAVSQPRKSQIPPYPRNSKFNALRPSQSSKLMDSPLLEPRNMSEQHNEKFNAILVQILKQLVERIIHMSKAVESLSTSQNNQK